MAAAPPADLGWRVDTQYAANGTRRDRVYLRIDGKEHELTRENLVMLRGVAEDGLKLLPAPYVTNYVVDDY